MSPLVSVLVAFRNEEKYLGKCIQSILDQNFRDIELVLIDDNSQDGSVKVVQRFKDKRIKLFRNKKNLGIARSRNISLAKASGKFCFFTDGDCIVDNNWIVEGLKSLKEGALGVEGRTDYMIKKPGFSNKVVQNKKGGEWMTCNMAYSLEAVKNAGGFDEKYGNLMEDRDLALRIKKQGTITFNSSMKVLHAAKKWTIKTMLERYFNAGRAKVLMFKYHGEANKTVPFIVYPGNLIKVLIPPLIFYTGIKNRIKSFEDIKFLFVHYLALLYERVGVWNAAFKERVFLI